VRVCVRACQWRGRMGVCVCVCVCVCSCQWRGRMGVSKEDTDDLVNSVNMANFVETFRSVRPSVGRRVHVRVCE